MEDTCASEVTRADVGHNVAAPTNSPFTFGVAWEGPTTYFSYEDVRVDVGQSSLVGEQGVDVGQGATISTTTQGWPHASASTTALGTLRVKSTVWSWHQGLCQWEVHTR